MVYLIYDKADKSALPWEKDKGCALQMSLNVVHGGDLDEISRIYGIDKSCIINFGGNVNPLGLPHSVKKAIRENASDAPTLYPDVSYVELKKAIGEYTGIDSAHILTGNGSTELIALCINAVKPRRAVIVSPAYSEYLRQIGLAGGSAELFPLREDEEYALNIERLEAVLDESVDMLVICNPNNPTGTYITCTEIRRLLEHCLKYGIRLMIDETYVEFASPGKQVSAMPLVEEYKNLFIVRGTSKFFACPGLRLGYGACSDKEITEYISSHRDSWSVNIFAELSGRVMFRDKKFIERTRSLIIGERERIFGELYNCGDIHIYDSQANFFLVRIKKDGVTSSQIFEELLRKNILIRDCADFPYLNERYIRFCILDKKSNSMLIKELKNILN